MKQRFFVLIAIAVAALMPTGTSAHRDALPNHLQDLKAARDAVRCGVDRCAALTQAQAGALLNRIAWQFRDEGFGLLRKDGGNRCPVSGLKYSVSCDWLVNATTGTGCDVLGSGPDPDGPGPSNPTWCSGEPFDVSKFLAPVDPGGVSPPAPPQGVTVTREEFAAAVQQLQELQRRVDAIVPAGVSEDRVQVLIDEAFAHAVVSGSTGRTWGHAHSVTLSIRRQP